MTSTETKPDPLTVAKTSPRSVSQVLTYQKCPYSYYLGKIARDDQGERIWDRPAAWLPMGTAVHAAVEAWEGSNRSASLEDAQDVYRTSYIEETEKLLAKGRMDTWFHSGPYDGESDIERRFKIGFEHVDRYVSWYTGKGSQDVVWVSDDGTPGIEMEFNIDLDGVAVRGYIDTVFRTPSNAIIVNDNKTGVKPGEVFQLATYAVALNDQYGVDVHHGQFFMTRKVKPDPLIDLFEVGREEVTAVYHELDQNVKAERFDPKPEPEKCSRCGFNSYCPFVAI